MRFLKHLITLIIIATILFFIVYLLMPDVSESYFGVSYSLTKENDLLGTVDIQNTIALLNNSFSDVGLTERQKYVIVEQLDSREVQDTLVKAAKEGRDSLAFAISKLASNANATTKELSYLEYKITQGLKTIRFNDFSRTAFSAINRGLNNLLNGN